MTKDEALKLALSALDEVRQETFRLMRNGETLYSEKKVWMAIYTIKKVLAQPKWVGLTDEEIWETVSRIGTSDSDVNPYAKLADARAIEAKLRSKNT